MPLSSSLPPIPLAFTKKKASILAALSQPASTYEDASPKGSVDEAVKPLIDKLNALDGIVTTSSCAGRLSVFLEGGDGDGISSEARANVNYINGGQEELSLGGDDKGTVSRGADHGKERLQVVKKTGNAKGVNPGGKGNGGRWLYVSHSPLEIGSASPSTTEATAETNLREDEEDVLFKLFGLTSSATKPQFSTTATREGNIRLVRLQFEPLILHIATASLHHAQPLLAAALNAGFRESGIQSLRNLDDAEAIPMLAVRALGLGFGSVVGYCAGDGGGGAAAAVTGSTSSVSFERRGGQGGEAGQSAGDDERRKQEIEMTGEGKEEEENVYSLVDATYLRLMVQVVNERFNANLDRMMRFEHEVDRLLRGQDEKGSLWEDRRQRARRKKEEGLKKQEERKQNAGTEEVEQRHALVDDSRTDDLDPLELDRIDVVFDEQPS